MAKKAIIYRGGLQPIFTNAGTGLSGNGQPTAKGVTKGVVNPKSIKPR